MTAERRARHIERRPDGSLWDTDVLRDYLASLVVPRIRVERRSLTDPFCAAVEATSRGRERAA